MATGLQVLYVQTNCKNIQNTRTIFRENGLSFLLTEIPVIRRLNISRRCPYNRFPLYF